MGGGMGMTTSQQVHQICFYREEKEGFCSFDNLPVETAFSIMRCGNMSSKYGDLEIAEQNFRNFCSVVCVSSNNRVHIHPVHGNKVIKTGGYHRGSSIACDGLITTERGLTLSLFPADCFPVILTDKEGSFAGLIHAGRKSVAAGIIDNATGLIKEWLKKSPESLVAAIGPGIMCCCYDTNLLQKITEQLLRAGVRGENIFLSYACTYCALDNEENPLFFSHRRAEDKHTKCIPVREGRNAVVVCISEAE